jgi:acetyl-CoA carboxylase biotin carboxylase subunit
MKKILIANRGEIALRIMRSLKEMGISPVAVYSEADAHSPHVLYADEAYCIGPAPSSESYLNGDKIIQISLDHGIWGIHPGYGFLSENAGFARKVRNAGLNFIGPSPEAMEVMGLKLAAKQAVKAFNVPLVPGTDEAISDFQEAIKICEEIGFPVLVKASAGGGGKGMRIVTRKEDLETEVGLAMSEAVNAFGDGAVFIEKYVTQPRHIEIQVLGDTHGNIVYLFERECSIQRRHQKVIEEAPSSVLSPELRRQMGEAAVNVCKACQYTNAGTVEFLLDENHKFYFLEMNTRLQVEHGVTELVTNTDIVELMIKIAEGVPLDITSISPNGHAIEARIYGEDPQDEFLPSSGQITEFPENLTASNIRLDSGVQSGNHISPYYDPMIAKVMSWGETREDALTSLSNCLDGFRIRGIQHNVGFLSSLIQNPLVSSGQAGDRRCAARRRTCADRADLEAAARISSLLALAREREAEASAA